MARHELHVYDSDREIEKMTSSALSRIEKKGGFEGCRNNGISCNFNGFCGAFYSEEGLCYKCEFIEHSYRYHGCVFCGKAIKFSAICSGCENGLQIFLFKLFYNLNEKSKSSLCQHCIGENDNNDFNMWTRIKSGITGVCKRYFKLVGPIRIFEEPALRSEWPGFHIGNNKWVTPDPFKIKNMIDISDILENSNKVMIRELEKIGIHIFDDIQIHNVHELNIL